MIAALCVASSACSVEVEDAATAGASGDSTSTTGVSSPGTTSISGSTSEAPGSSGGAWTGSTTGNAEESSDGGPLFDIPQSDVGGRPPSPSCRILPGQESGAAPCSDAPLPESFEPRLQWQFDGVDDDARMLTIPLVGNLTDDNDDGAIDLCDTPDVVAVVGPTFPIGGGNECSGGHIYVLDGATGDVHFRVDGWVQQAATPAIGDIDGDGLMEIVTVEPCDAPPAEAATCALVAFEHDGTPKWTGATVNNCQTTAIALANLDNEGAPEIIAGTQVFDADGQELFADTVSDVYAAPTAADLDGDGDLEVLFGHSAYHHDGALIWSYPELRESPLTAAFNIYDVAHPQVANFDEDDDPEVLITGTTGVWLLEADGTIIYQDWRPTGEERDWNRPVAIHDFDADGEAEFTLSSEFHFGVYEANQDLLWVADVIDESGQAGGTAFDFMGTGQAQAIYADEFDARVFDETGATLLEYARSSLTWIEYPVVADVDNDGSAELLVSADNGDGWALRVVEEENNGWTAARRIWNQHTYHVTNIREDGTIPEVESPHWLGLNTFRTQAQIGDGGSVCQPEG